MRIAKHRLRLSFRLIVCFATLAIIISVSVLRSGCISRGPDWRKASLEEVRKIFWSSQPMTILWILVSLVDVESAKSVYLLSPLIDQTEHINMKCNLVGHSTINIANSVLRRCFVTMLHVTLISRSASESIGKLISRCHRYFCNRQNEACKIIYT